MAVYRLYYLSPAGKLIRREEVTADTDAEAIAKVGSPDTLAVVELWLGGQRIHRSEPTG